VALAANVEIGAVARIAIALEAYEWPFAAERRGEIDRHFARFQRDRPGVWNGRVLLLKSFAIEGDALRGVCFEADYASFCAWRDWGFPDPNVHNVFAAAALRSADGAYLLGEMAQSTANAGLLYFPCGTPEPADLDRDGMLDLDHNLDRELLEETGIGRGELAAEPGWSVVRDRGFVALIKSLAAPQNGADLRARIVNHIAGEERPELVDIRIVRGPADLDPRIPRFVVAFLQHMWRQ
jgi:hypothetical protein